MLATSKLPTSYSWYHLRAATDVSRLLPSRADPSSCPYFRFTGRKPSCAGVRTVGCSVHPKLYLLPHKLADQSTRWVHLGRAIDQSGHPCLDPKTGRIHTLPHCRFIETEFDGLACGDSEKPVAIDAYFLPEMLKRRNGCDHQSLLNNITMTAPRGSVEKLAPSHMLRRAHATVRSMYN
eukprot:3677631-Pleurochrysis_carterae.AAC.1